MLMAEDRRRSPRYPFVASAEVVTDDSRVRIGDVRDLSIDGAYLSLASPFPRGALLLIRIRTKTAFFQSYATVAHSTPGLGIGITFKNTAPPFRIVLQNWLTQALQEAGQRGG